MPEIRQVMEQVEVELRRATALHGPMRSSHEGLGVLVEEMLELVLAVTTNDLAAVTAEALQVAAMGARIVLDLAPSDPS